jgi:hypothetical protein
MLRDRQGFVGPDLVSGRELPVWPPTRTRPDTRSGPTLRVTSVINSEGAGAVWLQSKMDAGGRICRRFFEGAVLSQSAQSAPQRRGTEVGEARPAERMSTREGTRDVLMASVPSVSRLGALCALGDSSGIGAVQPQPEMECLLIVS